MSDDNPPRIPVAPFASGSWEPRFVIEHYGVEPLQHAVELWRLGNSGRWYPNDVIRYAKREPACLQLAHPGPHGHPGFEELGTQVRVVDAPALILEWLKTATYPEQPWFDGGEAKGYCVYHAYWRSEHVGQYRSLVVIPKWLEIHK